MKFPAIGTHASDLGWNPGLLLLGRETFHVSHSTIQTDDEQKPNYFSEGWVSVAVGTAGIDWCSSHKMGHLRFVPTTQKGKMKKWHKTQTP